MSIQFTEIDSLDIHGLEVYANLSERELLRYREPCEGLFIAESPKVISRALHAGYEPVSVLLEKKMLNRETDALIDYIHERHDRSENAFPVFIAEEKVLRKLTGFPLTRGVLCAMNRRPLPSVVSLVSSLRRIAVLENVMNPTNVGAIFRSAAAMGMEAVLLTGGSADPLYRRAARVSMGTVFQVPWTFAEENWQETLRKCGFMTCAMAINESARTIDDPALKAVEKLAVVLGTEGDGLSPATISNCDYQAVIPMAAGIDSLNVAAASAVAFWELGRWIKAGNPSRYAHF